MLKIEWEDLFAVLKLTAPYVVTLLIILAIGVVIIIGVRKKQAPIKYLIRRQTMLGMILTLGIIVNLICMGPLSAIISLSMGNGTVSDETADVAMKKAEEITSEGIVLLENKDLLPLKETAQNINLFGWASVNPLYGGAGSGGINDLYPKVSLIDGIKNAGFNINSTLVDFYTDYTSERPEMSIQKQSWTLPEPPANTYSDTLIDTAKEFSDVAVIVLSRMAGEGHHDMPGDVSQVSFDHNSEDYNDFETGEHYLQLSKSERDMVELVTSNFEDVIVIYNGANPIELGFVDDYEQIKSVLWVPGPGNVGFNALGKILNGEINPSGRTPDTFIYDMKTAPWWNNWNKRNYDNMEQLSVEGMSAGTPEIFLPSFINYNEGIYVGYKYYETAAQEGVINYDETVQYSFGHGLSYTDFEQKMSDLREEDGKISFDVTITNTGDTEGKDVVEVFANPPYENGGIEKASANLVAFDKTEELSPGESQTIEMEVSLDDMASYDYQIEQAYVLDEGTYEISINKNSHEIIDQKVYQVSEKEVFKDDNKRSTDRETAINRFDEAAGDVEYLSRKDQFSNLVSATDAPESTTLSEEYVDGYYVNSNFDYSAYLNDNDLMPKTGQDNGLELVDLREATYDDPRWQLLVEQMSVEDMKQLIALAGYQTSAISSVGKVQTVDVDGPAALNNNFTKAGSVGFPVAVVISSTWNKQLAKDYGEIMGQMAKEMNVAGWYAPGMNTHRMAFGGRNYEYYSEDGVLAGAIASNTVQGAREKGVYSFIKHFALYDSNAKMVSIWSNEQAIREIYLKPFEKAIKDGNANALMVSWNYIGNKWAGGTTELMKDVLRGEWGFQGMALTDFFRNNGHGFMNADLALASGVDAMLSTFDGEANNVRDASAPTSVIAMQEASKNILYTNVSSWPYASENLNTGLQTWQKVAFAIDTVLVLALVVSSVLVLKKYRSMK